MSDLLLNPYQLKYLVGSDFNNPSGQLFGQEVFVPQYGCEVHPTVSIPVGSTLVLPFSTLMSGTGNLKLVVVNHDGVNPIQLQLNQSNGDSGFGAPIVLPGLQPGGKFEHTLSMPYINECQLQLGNGAGTVILASILMAA